MSQTTEDFCQIIYGIYFDLQIMNGNNGIKAKFNDLNDDIRI